VQNALLVPVAMLSSLYQSAVKVEGNATPKWITVIIVIFHAWKLYSYLEELKGLPSQGQGDE
jgi:hypothetical protein